MIPNRYKLLLLISLFWAEGLAQSVPELEFYYAPQPMSRNYFFVKGGSNIPTSQFAETPNADEPLLAPFIGEDGMGGKTGFSISSGYRFGWSAPKYENTFFAISGLSASFKYNSIHKWYDLNWDAGMQENNYIFNAGGMNGFFLDFSSGLGYNVKNTLILELNGSIHFPLRVGFPSVSYEPYESNQSDVFKFSVEPDGVSQTRLGTGLEILIRTNQYSFGLEWFQYNARKEYHYNFPSLLISEDFVAEFKWKTFQLMLGLCF